MEGQKFYIQVSKKGMLQFYDIEAFQKATQANAGFKGFISFQKIANDDSIQAMFQLYDWWLDLIAKELYEPKQNVDDTLSHLFLAEQKWNKILARPITTFKNKAEMSYNDWIMFLRNIIKMCTETLNFVDDNGNTRLPIPNNLKSRL